MTCSLALISAFAVLLAACSDDSGSGSTGIFGAAGASSANATRSADCLEMQDAICDWSVDRCNHTTRSTCDSTYQSLFCKSDDLARACTEAVKSADCTSGADLVAKCDLPVIADPAPALAQCKAFIAAVCEGAARCNSPSAGPSCQSTNEAKLCVNVVGASPAMATCIAEVKALSCSAQAAPASCNGVVKQTQAIEPGGSQWQSLVEVVAPGLSVQ